MSVRENLFQPDETSEIQNLIEQACFFFTEIMLPIESSRAHHEGRFAIVTNVGRGMRWARRVAAGYVLPTNDPARTVKPCGPGIPTLMPSP